MRFVSTVLVAGLMILPACTREESTVSAEAEADRAKQAEAVYASTTPATTTSAAPAGEARTIIEVNGETIDEFEFAAAIEALPERMKATVQSAAGRRALADELVRLKLLEQEARRLGVVKEADVARAIEMSTANILASAALRKLAETEPSDEELRKLYQDTRGQYEAVRAQQITIAYKGGAVPALRGETPDENAALAKARRAVERLRGGEKFESVAGEMSDDPMFSQSGGLMVLRKGEIPPNVEKAVFGLATGAVSDPVKSEIGYHVFEMLEKETPTFEQLRPTLVRQARQTRVEQIVEQLKGKAKVTLNETFIENPSSADQTGS